MAAERPLPITDPMIPWDLTQPRAGEEALRRMRSALTPGSGFDQVKSSGILTQIARAESLQGKLNEADRTLDEAAKLVSTSTDVEAKLRVLLERGRLFTLKRTPAAARECFLEVWETARASGFDLHAVDAAQMLSLVETPKQRGAWTQRALDLAEGSADMNVRRWRGDLHVALGKHHESLLKLPEAIASFERAAACFAQDGAAQKVSLTRSLMGHVYRLSRRIEEALEIQRSVLQELGTTTGADLAFVLEELAECLVALRRTEEAEAYFKRAFEAVRDDEWFASNEPARLKRIKTMGKAK